MKKNFTPVLVVAAALTDGRGRWLMHRRPDHKDHGGLWEFPGGKVEEDETPKAALAREIAEETTLVVTEDDFLEVGFASCGPDGQSPAIVIILYTASRWDGEVSSPEGGLLQWFDKSGIERLDMPPLDRILASQLLVRHG